MSFEDLPDDWPTRSLDDERLARDVLDLVVRERDRQEPAMAVLLCNSAGRLQQPVFVQGATTAEDLERGFLVLRGTALHPAVGEDDDPATLAPAVLVGLVRPSGGVTDTDRAWHQRAIEACRAAEVALLGVHVVTARGVETLPGPVAGSSAA
jgi:hypothetical protein